ncbi:RNA polymerase sigma factor [soil metagenome]
MRTLREERAGGRRTGAVPSTPPPFQVFLDEHRTVVYRFLLAAVGSAEADDCFQETFLSALRAYPRLREASNLRGWILTIASRKVVDAARARNRRPLSIADPAELEDGRSREAGRGVEPATDADDSLWRAVATLPPRQRVAVAHRFVLDLPYAAIAAAMGSTQEAARANVYQGLRALRERLEPDDGT